MTLMYLMLIRLLMKGLVICEMHDSYYNELREMTGMNMETYVNNNILRLENDYKVIKDLPLDKEIPDKYDMSLSNYISDRYKMEMVKQ